MKLAKIAVSVAVVLGAVATGGSWYTGKQVEQRYTELVQQANESLKSLKMYGLEAELKDVNIERGLFSSDVSYNLELKTPEENHLVKGSDKLYHGPFPLNRVSSGNVLPAMASVESRLDVPDTLKKFFDKTWFVQGKTDISYAENFTGEFTLQGLKEGSLPFFFGDSTFAYDLNKSGEGKITAKLPKLEMEIVENTGLKFSVEQVEYTMSLQGKSDYEYISLGDFNGSVKAYSFTANDDSMPNFAFTDVKFNSSGKVVGGVYQSTGDVVGNLQISNKESQHTLGQLNMAMFVALDAKLYNHVMNYLSSPELLQTPDEAQQAFKQLVTKGVQFHLKDVTLANDKGKNQLSLIINSKPFEWNEDLTIEKVLSLFSQSKLEAKVSLPALEEMMKQFFSLNPETKDNAEKLAKSLIADLHAAAQNGMVETDGDTLKFNLALDNGSLTLNGEELSEEQTQFFLWMVLMGLGSVR